MISVEEGKGIDLGKAKTMKVILGMKKFFGVKNYSILEALLFWKENIELEFNGISECMICYFVIHAADKQLPKKPCKNCNQKFHPACIQKWMKSSHKNECPLCKSQFL